jgi:hypothetical protein
MDADKIGFRFLRGSAVIRNPQSAIRNSKFPLQSRAKPLFSAPPKFYG